MCEYPKYGTNAVYRISEYLVWWGVVTDWFQEITKMCENGCVSFSQPKCTSPLGHLELRVPQVKKLYCRKQKALTVFIYRFFELRYIFYSDKKEDNHIFFVFYWS